MQEHQDHAGAFQPALNANVLCPHMNAKTISNPKQAYTQPHRFAMLGLAFYGPSRNQQDSSANPGASFLFQAIYLSHLTKTFTRQWPCTGAKPRPSNNGLQDHRQARPLCVGPSQGLPRRRITLACLEDARHKNRVGASCMSWSTHARTHAPPTLSSVH